MASVILLNLVPIESSDCNNQFFHTYMEGGAGSTCWSKTVTVEYVSTIKHEGSSDWPGTFPSG